MPLFSTFARQVRSRRSTTVFSIKTNDIASLDTCLRDSREAVCSMKSKISGPLTIASPGLTGDSFSRKSTLESGAERGAPPGSAFCALFVNCLTLYSRLIYIIITNLLFEMHTYTLLSSTHHLATISCSRARQRRIYTRQLRLSRTLERCWREVVPGCLALFSINFEFSMLPLSSLQI